MQILAVLVGVLVIVISAKIAFADAFEQPEINKHDGK